MGIIRRNANTNVNTLTFMARRKPSEPIDWPPIQREYCLGQITVRNLAATHGVDASVIVRKAKQQGWIRDKRQEVKTLSEAQLIAIGLDPEGKGSSTPTTPDIQAAATARTNVILAHRRDAVRTRSLAMTMMEELEVMTRAPVLLRDLQETLRKCKAGEDIPPDVLQHADHLLGQVMTLDSRAGTLKTLSETLTKVVGIEREAFGIGTPDDGDKPASGDTVALTGAMSAHAKRMEQAFAKASAAIAAASTGVQPE